MASSFFRRDPDRSAAPSSPGVEAAASAISGHIDGWTRIGNRAGYLVDGWCTEAGPPAVELIEGTDRHRVAVEWILRFPRPDAARATGIGGANAAADRLGFVLFVLDVADARPTQVSLRFASLAVETQTPVADAVERAQQLIALAWSQCDANARTALGTTLPAELLAAVRNPLSIAHEGAGSRSTTHVDPELWGCIDSWVRVSSRPGYLVEGWCRASDPRVVLFNGSQGRAGRIGWTLRFARPDAARVLGRADGGTELGLVLFVHDDALPVDRIVIEQSDADGAQRDANPMDAARPQAVTATLWSQRGFEWIERFGRTPPPEILAMVARPLADCVGTFAFHVDHLSEVPPQGLLIAGWLTEREPGTAQMVLVDERSGSWVDVSTGWNRTESTVSATELQAPCDPSSALPGFIALLRTPPIAPFYGPQGSTLAVYVIARSGEVASQRLCLDRRPQGPDEVMNTLRFVPGAGAGSDAVIERHVGPAIAAWLRMDHARAAIVRDDCFGEVPARPHTTIVIPVRGGEDRVRVQLARMALDPALHDAVELILVVDDLRLVEAVWRNADPWRTAYGLPFRLLATSGQVGNAATLNLGSGRANGEFLALLDADCIPDRPGWLIQLLHALRSDPACGAAGPTLLSGDDTIRSQGYRLGRDPGSADFRSVVDLAPGPLDRQGAPAPVKVDAVSGACLVTRREGFDRLGGFESGFLSGHHAAAILCHRLASLGFHTMLLPQVRLYHLDGAAPPASTESAVAESIPKATLDRYHAWQLSRRLTTLESTA
ncbi:MAG: glycosyltransferase family 2 protein [Panacagrimonas sp.]